MAKVLENYGHSCFCELKFKKLPDEVKNSFVEMGFLEVDMNGNRDNAYRRSKYFTLY